MYDDVWNRSPPTSPTKEKLKQKHQKKKKQKMEKIRESGRKVREIEDWRGNNAEHKVAEITLL